MLVNPRLINALKIILRKSAIKTLLYEINFFSVRLEIMIPLIKKKLICENNSSTLFLESCAAKIFYMIKFNNKARKYLQTKSSSQGKI